MKQCLPPNRTDLRIMWWCCQCDGCCWPLLLYCCCCMNECHCYHLHHHIAHLESRINHRSCRTRVYDSSYPFFLSLSLYFVLLELQHNPRPRLFLSCQAALPPRSPAHHNGNRVMPSQLLTLNSMESPLTRIHGPLHPRQTFRRPRDHPITLQRANSFAAWRTVSSSVATTSCSISS